jgi:hypothetical protein
MSARANSQARPERGRDWLDEQAVGEAMSTATEIAPSQRRTERDGQQPEQVRCSPDPMQHTDRYRLVTPFSLRL